MFCMNCGKESKDGARFCEFCGKELPPAPKTGKGSKVPIVPIIIGAAALMLIGVGVLIAVSVSKGKAAKIAVEETVETVDEEETFEDLPNTGIIR
ncbi:MAG: zinc-ribbon domain-containing protein [Lachnospiraceae bacterium]|nr:zinc-ribbon domain-containing protein [Lachnospiraceae bacterium]